MPEVSVIIPFYNAEYTLNAAIESIIDQSFQDYELILVDNNSTDRSLEIAVSWQKKYSKILTLSESQRGVVHAMNKGLEIASGKYIARMDADDTSDGTRLEKQVNYLASNPSVSLLFTQVDCPGSFLKNEGLLEYIKWSNQICSWEDFRRNTFVEYPGINPSMMIRREVYEKTGKYMDGDFPEDYEFYLRAVRHGLTAEKIPEVLLIWNDSEERLTRTDTRYSRDAFQSIKSVYLASSLKRRFGSVPSIWVWGAGKLALRWSEMLEKEGVKINGFIDVDAGKVSDNPSVIHYTDIDLNDQNFIVSLVSNRGKREEIRSFLKSRRYIEEKDFIIAA
jgi:glycosyltransferase involved in cell wall biosynthesis